MLALIDNSIALSGLVKRQRRGAAVARAVQPVEYALLPLILTSSGSSYPVCRAGPTLSAEEEPTIRGQRSTAS